MLQTDFFNKTKLFCSPSEAGIWVMYSILYDEKVSKDEIKKATLGKPIKGVDIRVMPLDCQDPRLISCPIGEY